jgi:hypothetical protein
MTSADIRIVLILINRGRIEFNSRNLRPVGPDSVSEVEEQLMRQLANSDPISWLVGGDHNAPTNVGVVPASAVIRLEINNLAEPADDPPQAFVIGEED